MTSFGGLVIFQKLFQVLGLPQGLRDCTSKLDQGSTRLYHFGTVLHCLVVHLIIGCRNLRDMDYYRDDPMILHTLGLKRLPSVPTLSRMLGEFDDETIGKQRVLSSDLVLSRLRDEGFRRITMDFDGSVLSTTRRAEGAAVGFNKKKKGARSYYPLFCTIAQSGQVFDYLHRSGNVHDSNGAIKFVTRCVLEVQAAMPGAKIEIRMDSAFFSDEMVTSLEALGADYTISVPFERFAKLKAMIEGRRRWWPMLGRKSGTAHFESSWKPESWSRRARFLFIRKEIKVQTKGPIQLDLFEPKQEGLEYKVVVTNKKGRAGGVVRFHEGRGSQEKLFGEIKPQAQMSYIPARKRVANEVYMLSSIMAHNLGRELQMRIGRPSRRTDAKRAARWVFEELGTLRKQIVQRAGRLVRPAGKLTLVFGTNPKLKKKILEFMAA